MTNKAIAAFVAGVFLFNDIASAADFRNLAPQTGVTVQEFKDRYLSGYILLSHKAVNSYIEKYLSIEDAELIRLIQSDIRWEKVKVRYNGKQETIDVRIVPIRKLSKNTALSKGFLTSTGQLAHIGLGNAKNIGSPSIYIDYDYRYDPDLLANEKEKIAKWEGKRRELGKTYRQMREWIQSNPEDARALAAQFHKTSRSISHLYDEIKKKYRIALNADNLEECQKILNFDVMCEYFDKFGLDEESNDANLAASPAKDKIDEFDRYLEKENIFQYEELRKIFSKNNPEIQIIKKELLEDPALRPVFLLLLPPKYLGTIEAIDEEVTSEIGGINILHRHSAILAGSAEHTNELAKQGHEIIVGIIDRYSRNTLHPLVSVANNRQVYFPLSDGTWLGVKGIGQFQETDRPPYFLSSGNQNIGMVTIEEAIRAEKSREVFKGSKGRRAQFLGYRKIGVLPYGQPNLVDATFLKESDGTPLTPVLVFNRTVHPHRLVKLPQLLEQDYRLEKLTKKISAALVRSGSLPPGTTLSPSSLMLMISREMGLSEAENINRGWYKYTTHSQDFNFAGEEHDNEEYFDKLTYTSHVLSGDANLETEDKEVLTQYGFGIAGVKRKIKVLTDMVMLTQWYEPYQIDMLFPNRPNLLKEFFTAFFEQLDDRLLKCWAPELTLKVARIKAIRYFYSKREGPEDFVEDSYWQGILCADINRWMQDARIRRGYGGQNSDHLTESNSGGAAVVPVALGASSATGPIVLAGMMTYLYLATQREKILEWLAIRSNRLKWYSPVFKALQYIAKYTLLPISKPYLAYILSSLSMFPVAIAVSDDGANAATPNIQTTLTITKLGVSNIHARPANAIASAAQIIKKELKIDLSITNLTTHKTASAESILDVMKLEAFRRDHLEITASPIGRDLSKAKEDIDFTLGLMKYLLNDGVALESGRPIDYIDWIDQYVKNKSVNAGGPAIGPVLLFMAVPSWIAIAKACAVLIGRVLADEYGGIGRRKDRKFYTMPQKVRDAWDELREAERLHREVMVTIVGINYSYGKDREGKKVRAAPSGFKVQFATSKGGVIAGFAHGDRTGLDFSRMPEEELKKYIPRKVMAKIVSCGKPGGEDPRFSFRIVEEPKIVPSKVQKFDEGPDTAKSRAAERTAREHEEERAGLREEYSKRAIELAAQRQAEAEERRVRVNLPPGKNSEGGDPTILGEGSRVMPRVKHEEKQERLKGQIEEIASALDKACEKLLYVSHTISEIRRYKKGPGEWFFDMRLAAREILANRNKIIPDNSIIFDAKARDRFTLKVGFGTSARDVIFELKNIIVDPGGGERRNQMGEREVPLESYNILEIIDPTFDMNHAGRNALTTYARTQGKSAHEFTELSYWIKFARRMGIASKADIENHELGDKIRLWANTALRNTVEENTQAAHDYACLNELEFMLNRKASSDMIELAKKKLFVDTDSRGALKFISDTEADLEITDSDNEWELDVSPDGKTIRISEDCLENRSPEFIEHRITHYVDYRRRLYGLMVNDPELSRVYQYDPVVCDWIAKLLCEHMWLEAIAKDGRDGTLAVSDLRSLYNGESESTAKKNNFQNDFWLKFIETSPENIVMVPIFKDEGQGISPDQLNVEFLRKKLDRNLAEMPLAGSEIEDGVEVDAPIFADAKPAPASGAAAGVARNGPSPEVPTFIQSKNRADQTRVLILCDYNLERSPLVADILQTSAKVPKALRSRLTFTSASIYPAPQDSRLREYTVRDPVLASHVQHYVTSEKIEKADIIFVMTKAQEKKISDEYPDARGKVFVLLGREDLNTGQGDYPLPEELYLHSAKAYQAVRKKIEENSGRIFKRIRRIIARQKSKLAVSQIAKSAEGAAAAAIQNVPSPSTSAKPMPAVSAPNKAVRDAFAGKAETATIGGSFPISAENVSVRIVEVYHQTNLYDAALIAQYGFYGEFEANACFHVWSKEKEAVEYRTGPWAPDQPVVLVFKVPSKYLGQSAEIQRIEGQAGLSRLTKVEKLPAEFLEKINSGPAPNKRTDKASLKLKRYLKKKKLGWLPPAFIDVAKTLDVNRRNYPGHFFGSDFESALMELQAKDAQMVKDESDSAAAAANAGKEDVPSGNVPDSKTTFESNWKDILLRLDFLADSRIGDVERLGVKGDVSVNAAFVEIGSQLDRLASMYQKDSEKLHVISAAMRRVIDSYERLRGKDMAYERIEENETLSSEERRVIAHYLLGLILTERLPNHLWVGNFSDLLEAVEPDLPKKDIEKMRLLFDEITLTTLEEIPRVSRGNKRSDFFDNIANIIIGKLKIIARSGPMIGVDKNSSSISEATNTLSRSAKPASEAAPIKGFNPRNIHRYKKPLDDPPLPDDETASAKGTAAAGEAENTGVQNKKPPVITQEASKGIPNPASDELSGVLGVTGNSKNPDKDNENQSADQKYKQSIHDQSPSLLAMMGVQDAILPAETFRDPHPYHSKVADVLDGGDPLQGAYLGVVYPERDEALAGSWKFDAANLRKLTGEISNGMLVPEARLGGFGFESWNTLDLTHNLPPYESSTLGAGRVAGGDNADDTAAVFQSSHKITPTIGLAENIVSSSTASQDKGVVETRLLNLIRTDAMPGDVADVNNIPIERVDSHQMPYVDTSIHVYTKDVNSNYKIYGPEVSAEPRSADPADGATAADSGVSLSYTSPEAPQSLASTVEATPAEGVTEPRSAKPGNDNRIDYRGPMGDSGGYLNTLIKEAADAFNRGDYHTAYDKAKEVVSWFDRMDRAENDDERLEVLEALDNLEPGPEEMSDFNESEATQARDILAKAAEALALPKVLENPAVKAGGKYSVPPGGYKKTGVSMRPLLLRFRKGLQGLSEEVVARLRSEAGIGDRRKILVEAGLGVAGALDGKFLISEVDKFLRQKQSVAAETAAPKHRILRHIGVVGRHLIAYSADDFHLIVKVPAKPEKVNDIVRFWVRQGYELARERLKGLAVPTMVVDATDGVTKPFGYILEKSGVRKSDLAIVQKKVIPVFEQLKNLSKEGKVSDAKALIDRYKKFVIAMFRRGVIDNDFNNPYWNYGLDPETGEILAFDFGDLVGDESDVYRFFEMLRVANKYFYDDLRTQVSKEVANYFKAIEFEEYDFYNESGELIFGADLKTAPVDEFKMTFPYTEEETRHIFMNHAVNHTGGTGRIENEKNLVMAVPATKFLQNEAVGPNLAMNDVTSTRGLVNRFSSHGYTPSNSGADDKPAPDDSAAAAEKWTGLGPNSEPPSDGAVETVSKNDTAKYELTDDDSHIEELIIYFLGVEKLVQQYADPGQAILRPEQLFKGMTLCLGLETGIDSRTKKPHVVRYNMSDYLRENGISTVGVSTAKDNPWQIRYVRARAQKLPFPDNYFDDAISFRLFDMTFSGIDLVGSMSLREFYAASARELRRVLKPNGKFYVQSNLFGNKFYEEFKKAGFKIIPLRRDPGQNNVNESFELHESLMLINLKEEDYKAAPRSAEPAPGAAAAEEKEALHRLLEKIGLKYAETWYEDIKALPEVRKAYRGDLSAFVRDIENNLDHPRTIISLAYSALMRYLEHPSITNLGRHGWMIEDLRQKLPGIIEKKLASQDPKEKALTVWDLGCGYLEPVLIASVILEEFDNHKEWSLPGEKIKVVIKAVDVDPETDGKIDMVLENGFPYDAEDVLLEKRLTPPVVKDLVRKYTGFVHKKENRRRIKELGLIEFVRESVTHKDRALNPAVESGDILYMSYVLWELTEEARAQVLERLKYIKEGALVYIRDVDDINIGGLLAGIGIKTTPLYTAETDVQHSSTTHVLIEGEKEHTETAPDYGAPATGEAENAEVQNKSNNGSVSERATSSQSTEPSAGQVRSAKGSGKPSPRKDIFPYKGMTKRSGDPKEVSIGDVRLEQPRELKPLPAPAAADIDKENPGTLPKSSLDVSLEGTGLSSEMKTSLDSSGAAAAGDATPKVPSTGTHQAKALFVGKLVKALSTIPENKLSRKRLDIALNSRARGIFRALTIYQKEQDIARGFNTKGVRYKPEYSQCLMCNAASEAFCEAFASVFKTHKVCWVTNQLDNHDWAIIDDKIIVDITYGQWWDKYVGKILVTTIDKAEMFKMLGEYKIRKEYIRKNRDSAQLLAEGAAAADSRIYRSDTPQKIHKTFSNTAESVSVPNRSASSMSTHEFDASRKNFLRALHVLNKYWWFIQDPQNGYYDKTELGFDLDTHSPIGSIVSGWSDYEFNGPGNNDSKLKIFGRIIRDRIAKGYLYSLSYEDAIEFFSLLRALGINTNHISLTDGEWRVATLDNILNVAVFSRVGQLIPQEEAVLTEMTGLLPQETRLIQINSLDTWKRIVEYKQTLSGSIAIAEPGASNYLYFLDFYASPAVILHEIIHILQYATFKAETATETFGRDLTALSRQNNDFVGMEMASKLRSLREGLILRGYEDWQVDSEMAARIYEKLFAVEFEAEARTTLKTDVTTQADYKWKAAIKNYGRDTFVERYYKKPNVSSDLRDIADMISMIRDLYEGSPILKFLQNYYLTLDPAIPLPKILMPQPGKSNQVRSEGISGEVAETAIAADAAKPVAETYTASSKPMPAVSANIDGGVTFTAMPVATDRTPADKHILEQLSQYGPVHFASGYTGLWNGMPEKDRRVAKSVYDGIFYLHLKVNRRIEDEIYGDVQNLFKYLVDKNEKVFFDNIRGMIGLVEFLDSPLFRKYLEIYRYEFTWVDMEEGCYVIRPITSTSGPQTTAPAKLHVLARHKGPINVSGAEFLEVLKEEENDDLLALARSADGVIFMDVARRGDIDDKTVYRETKILEELGIFVTARLPKHYKLADIFIGPDANYTRTMINVVNNVKFRVKQAGDERPLHRNSIPEKMIALVKEILRLHITDYIYTHIEETKPADKTYAIRLWDGYGGMTQKELLQMIRMKTENGPYKITFEKLEDLANFVNLDEKAVVVLPSREYDKLDESQKAAIGKKGGAILADLDKPELGVFDAVPLEELIGAGKAYLNDDEESFYMLYRSLTGYTSSEYRRTSLAALKEDPSLFVKNLRFVLKPITAHNLDELTKINARLKYLLESA